MKVLQQLADLAVAQARRRLKGAEPDLVSGVFSYGAVDVDPEHLVVWVLLKGDPEKIPTWYFPGDDDAEALDAGGLRALTSSCVAVVREELALVGWPEAQRARVGFESEERARSGGWHYFR